jgi:hypothetical protein
MNYVWNSLKRCENIWLGQIEDEKNSRYNNPSELAKLQKELKAIQKSMKIIEKCN